MSAKICSRSEEEGSVVPGVCSEVGTVNHCEEEMEASGSLVARGIWADNSRDLCGALFTCLDFFKGCSVGETKVLVAPG